MKTTDNGRAQRARQNQRLRSLTVGTAVLAAVATGGFSLVAATTYAGTTSGTSTARTTSDGSALSGIAAQVTAVGGRHAHASTGGS